MASSTVLQAASKAITKRYDQSLPSGRICAEDRVAGGIVEHTSFEGRIAPARRGQYLITKERIPRGRGVGDRRDCRPNADHLLPRVRAHAPLDEKTLDGR